MNSILKKDDRHKQMRTKGGKNTIREDPGRWRPDIMGQPIFTAENKPALRKFIPAYKDHWIRQDQAALSFQAAFFLF
jgi:hypothetical protein